MKLSIMSLIAATAAAIGPAPAEETAPDFAAMTAGRLREIAQSPDSDDDVPEPLQIYAPYRDLVVELDIRIAQKNGEPETLHTWYLAEQSRVDGHFLVFKFALPGHDEVSAIVIAWDADAEVYRKWTLLPDGYAAEAIGVRQGKRPVISWASSYKDTAGAPILSAAQETHTDVGWKWTETLFVDGKFSQTIQGTAIEADEEVKAEDARLRQEDEEEK